jgi:hypothetical protein
MALKIFSPGPEKPRHVSPAKLKIFLVIVIAMLLCWIFLTIFNR